MLNTTKLQNVYDGAMDAWLDAYGSPLPDDRCDLCGTKSNGILYNVLGANGAELLVCYACYILVAGGTGRES